MGEEVVVDGRHALPVPALRGEYQMINAAAALQDLIDAPILLHPADRMLWDVVYPDRAPDRAPVSCMRRSATSGTTTGRPRLSIAT